MMESILRKNKSNGSDSHLVGLSDGFRSLRLNGRYSGLTQRMEEWQKLPGRDARTSIRFPVKKIRWITFRLSFERGSSTVMVRSKEKDLGLRNESP